MKTIFETPTIFRSRASTAAVLALAVLAFVPCSFSADWLQIGGNPQKDNWNRSESAITPANAHTLFSLFNHSMPTATDGTPVYLSNATTTAGTGNVVFVLGQKGQLQALNATSGSLIWQHNYTTGGVCSYNNSSPAIDPSGQFVYALGLDGLIHKSKVLDGSEVTGGGWPQLFAGSGQKLNSLGWATARNGHTYLYAVNGFCGHTIGHVTAVDLSTGANNVFNYSCSNITIYTTTNQPGAVPWCKAAPVYDPVTDLIFAATKDGGFHPTTFEWGQSCVAIHADGTGDGAGNPVDNFTPTNWQSLGSADLDLAPHALCLLPDVPGANRPHLGVQSGKPSTLWLVDRTNLSGQGGPGHTGGEVQSMGMPQGTGNFGVEGQFASWVNPADNTVWFFAGNERGISGIKIQVDANGNPSMHTQWTDSISGVQSVVVANGVVYFATNGGGQGGGAGRAYALNALTGSTLFSAGTGTRHWSSVIVCNGVLYVPDGNTGDQCGGCGGSLKAWTVNAGPPPPPPNPPTSLAASAPAWNQVNLTWTASTTSGVTYNIHRSTTSGFTADGTNEVASAISGTSYTDSIGLSGSTTYYYLAQASNAGGNSVSSNQATVTTPAAPPPPNPPTNATATAVSGTEIDLAWTASTTSGVTYRVYRKESGGGFLPSADTLIATGITTTSYADTDKSKDPNAPYYYDITAVTSAGAESVSANQVNAITLDVIKLQATALSPTGSGQTITSTNDVNAPGGTWVKIASTAVGQYIQFTTTSIPAATYKLSFIYRSNPTRAQHHFAVDGTQLDTTPVDQYASAFGYPPAVDIGSSNVAFSTAGTHVIKLAVSGHNAASSNYDVAAVQFIFDQQATGGGQQVATPTFTPGAGTYGSAQSVTISTSTPNAAIRYTTDGSTPTTLNGTVYSGPVTISTNTLLQAVGYETGYNVSNVASANYTITGGQVAAPTFSPVAGTYTTAQNVTITSATAGASIRYTTDGSTPSETAGTLYSGPVNISATTTLKAIAYKSGSTDSTVTSGTYTIASIITLQATSLSPTGSGQTITSTNDTNAPGGTWIKISSTAVGQFIKFTTTTIPAGTYQVSFKYRTNPTRAQHNVQIDGTTISLSSVDQYASAFSYPPAVNVGNPVIFGSATTHTIQLNATGKNAASTNFDISAVQFIFTPQ